MRFWPERGIVGNPVAVFLLGLALWLVILALFHTFPSWDIAVANWLFTPFDCLDAVIPGRTCGVFILWKSHGLRTIRRLSLLVPYLTVAGMFIVPLIASWPRPARPLAGQLKAGMIAIVALALGPILLVNGVFKSFWGRPRPRDTLFYGGHFDFVPAGSLVGKCADNCSFVSGEAATAGWLFCLIFLLPRNLRLPLGLPIAGISIYLTALRVMFGAHFLSDAVLGWLLSVVVFAGVVAVSEIRTRDERNRQGRQLSIPK